ncbi:MAG: hypothetical protein ABSH03_22760 [Candidatus Lustribacter sp.]|jgi:hypothetical protein
MRTLIALCVLAAVLFAGPAQAAPRAAKQTALPKCKPGDPMVLYSLRDGWYFGANSDPYRNALALRTAGLPFNGKFVCRSSPARVGAIGYQTTSDMGNTGSYGPSH